MTTSRRDFNPWRTIADPRTRGDIEQSASMLERPLPHSAHAEREILGAVILDNRLLASVLAMLKREMFYVRAHQFVFDAMAMLAERDLEINPINVGEELRRVGTLEQVGSVALISELTHGLPRITNVRQHAKLIKDKYILRQLVSRLNKATTLVLEEEELPDVVLKAAESTIVELAREYESGQGRGRRSFKQIAQDVREQFSQWQLGKTNALRTGIPELDAKLKLGGLARGDFIVIGAPPSVGKTAFALWVAYLVARRGHKVLIFSLEMRDRSLFCRVLAGEADVANWKIRPDMFQYEETVNKVAGAFSVVEELPIEVDDSTSTLPRFLTVSRDFVRNDGGDLILLDYIQLMDAQRDDLNRERQVAAISTGCKLTAKALDVPVVALTQFSRGAGKDGAKPALGSSRDSGQIEQDADLVLFPYGAGVGDDDEVGVRQLKLFCPKQRDGRAGWEVDIEFDADAQRFYTPEMYRLMKEERALDTRAAAPNLIEQAREAITEKGAKTDETLDDFDFNEGVE